MFFLSAKFSLSTREESLTNARFSKMRFFFKMAMWFTVIPLHLILVGVKATANVDIPGVIILDVGHYLITSQRFYSMFYHLFSYFYKKKLIKMSFYE